MTKEIDEAEAEKMMFGEKFHKNVAKADHFIRNFVRGAIFAAMSIALAGVGVALLSRFSPITPKEQFWFISLAAWPLWLFCFLIFRTKRKKPLEAKS